MSTEIDEIFGQIASYPISPNNSNADRQTWDDPANGAIYTEMANHTNIGPLPGYADRWQEIDNGAALKATGVVTPEGIMSLRLRDGVRVDMTIDKAVRVFNPKNNIMLAVNKLGDSAALLHPNGRVYQYGSRVEILAHDLKHGNHKYAKMWHNGISFTSFECAFTYLVDLIGTRTISDTFTDLTQNFALGVFYKGACVGAEYVPKALEIFDNSQYYVSEDMAEHWIVNNLRITQASDGLLRIARSSNKYQIRTSPLNGTASLTTPFVHTTASHGSTAHLFVRRGERRMHFDGSSFIVRNASQSAGFDDKNQLKVY